MKPKKGMQCKDIPDLPILAFLASHAPGTWHNWYFGDHLDVRNAMPECPDKLVLAKMRRLMERGLVDGCGCGCRGDFTITEEGIAYLLAAYTAATQGKGVTSRSA